MYWSCYSVLFLHCMRCRSAVHANKISLSVCHDPPSFSQRYWKRYNTDVQYNVYLVLDLISWIYWDFYFAGNSSKNPTPFRNKNSTEIKLFRSKIICSISMGSWKTKTNIVASTLVSWFSQAACSLSSLAGVRQSWELGPPAQVTSWDSDQCDASVAELSWNYSP